ncbi:MAG TPA: hypothetical protein VFE03_07695 [Caulobacteraceae bacterium]|jgi:hypothetical protein|nr:hypothetical protein [Caulobacteraceae bacterium]
MGARRAKLKALERQLREMFRRLGEATPAHLAQTLERLEERPRPPNAGPA